MTPTAQPASELPEPEVYGWRDSKAHCIFIAEPPIADDEPDIVGWYTAAQMLAFRAEAVAQDGWVRVPRELLDDALSALSHLGWCQTCAEENWSACIDGGREAQATKDKLESFLAASPPQDSAP